MSGGELSENNNQPRLKSAGILKEDKKKKLLIINPEAEVCTGRKRSSSKRSFPSRLSTSGRSGRSHYSSASARSLRSLCSSASNWDELLFSDDTSTCRRPDESPDAAMYGIGRAKSNIHDPPPVKRVEPISMEEILDAFQAEAIRRLRPALLLATKIRNQANPSVKEIISIYDRPIACDRFTGKPILLRQVIEEEMTSDRPDGNTLALNKAIFQIAMETQAKAQHMLQRVQSSKHNKDLDDFRHWYTEIIETLDKDLTTATKRDTCSTTLQPIDTKTVVQAKKQLPSYLMAKGEVRLPSLIRMKDGTACCNPGRYRQHAFNSRHFFLTENQSHCDVSSPHSRGWEPLTKEALLEYTSVTEVPVKDKTLDYRLLKSQFRLWRPKEAQTSSSPAMSSAGSQRSMQETMEYLKGYPYVHPTAIAHSLYQNYNPPV